MVWLEGTVGIGEKGRATKASPVIAKPVRGKYLLSGWLRPHLIDHRGAVQGKPFVLESGSIRFQVIGASESVSANPK